MDPDGREIGDYYNFKGEWLGTDNKRDGKIYFGESIANRKVSTCYNDLYYAQQDYDLSIGTPESSMEFATVLQSGEIEHYKSSSSAGDQVRVNAGSTTENPSGTFEHSHPINFANGYAGPELLSNKDIESFKYFQLNIVVGQTIPEDAYSMRIPMCCFYDCNSTLLGSIEMKDLKKVIADQFVRNNMLIVPTELLIKEHLER